MPLKKICTRSNFYTYFEIPEDIDLYSCLLNVLNLIHYTYNFNLYKAWKVLSSMTYFYLCHYYVKV